MCVAYRINISNELHQNACYFVRLLQAIGKSIILELHWKNWSCSKLQTNFHKNQPNRSIFREKKVKHFKCLHELICWNPIFIANGKLISKILYLLITWSNFFKNTQPSNCVSKMKKRTQVGKKINKNRFFITKQKKTFS